MNIQELKEALRLLAKEDPKFLAEIIEPIVKEHLVIASKSDGDYYNPGTTYTLNWRDEGYGLTEFSTAY